MGRWTSPVGQKWTASEGGGVLGSAEGTALLSRDRARTDDFVGDNKY